MRPERSSTSADQRLHVIVVNDFAAVTGGLDRVALAATAGLARRGHRVTLVAGHGQPDPELVEAGVEVRHTRQGTTLSDPNRVRAAAQGVWNRTAATLIREVCAEADPYGTVVHVHGFVKVLSASVIRAAAQSGLSTVATLHDYFAACPNGGFFNYQTDEICPLTPLSAECVKTHCDARAYSHKLWRVTRSVVQKQIGEMPSAIGAFVIPSDFAADILRPYLPANRPVRVLSNPISAVQTAPAEVAAAERFALVGRLQRDKGGIVFAEAARKASVPAVFVGDGDEADAIRRVNPDAELTGWLDTTGVQTNIRRARAVVNASLIYETQGLTLLEAAAHGVPGIVSETSVAREAVADDVSGLWFRTGDSDHLAEKLTELHGDPARAVRLGRAAYDRYWADPPDLTSHLDGLEELYGDVLRSRRIA